MPDSSTRTELDGLFARLPIALYRTSVDGRVLTANAATAKLLGYATVQDLIEVADIAEHCYVDPQRRLDWQLVLESQGVVYDFDVQLRRADGTLVWARDTARAVHDEDGRVRFYEGVLVDVTAEVEATEARNVLSGVLDATSDMVVLFAENGTLRYANGASAGFLGLDPEWDGSTPHIREFFPEVDWDRFLSSIDEKGWSGEVSLPDADGRPSPLWVVVTLHHDRNGARFVSATARDLTMIKRTQDRLEELLTAKDVFVATVSHELRHPLTGVLGLAEELRDRFSEFDTGEIKDLISVIADESAEMMSLVDDLLVAVRADGGEIAVVVETVDVIETLTAVAGTTEGDVTWNLPDGPVKAITDPHRFRQILRNLLSNADRHGGGDIRVDVSVDPDRVSVRVSDAGPGVGTADAERIFEPYHRASGASLKRGSLGLGLSVARRLARLMNGDLSYMRDEDRTIFEFTLPTAHGLGLG